VTRAVVGVVISAVVAGDVTSAVLGGVVIGAGAGAEGVVIGAVVRELGTPRLSPELVIGPAISTPQTARTPMMLAAPPSNGASQPGLSSATSRPTRACRPRPRPCSTSGVSSVVTPVSKASLEARSSPVGLSEAANDVPVGAAVSGAEANRCSGAFSMARLTAPNTTGAAGPNLPAAIHDAGISGWAS